MPELTPSTREAARRIGVSEAALRKAERAAASPASRTGAGTSTRPAAACWRPPTRTARRWPTAPPPPPPPHGTPYARLKVAQLALKVEAQRLALDESKRRLLDVAAADAAIDEIAGAMRDALLNWPARVSGLIAAELGVDPHLLQTILQGHVADLLSEAADRFDPAGLGGETAVRTREHVHRRAGAMLRPPPLLTVSEWAERHRVLGSRASAEPGPWRTSRTPYLRR